MPASTDHKMRLTFEMLYEKFLPFYFINAALRCLCDLCFEFFVHLAGACISQKFPICPKIPGSGCLSLQHRRQKVGFLLKIFIYYFI